MLSFVTILGYISIIIRTSLIFKTLDWSRNLRNIFICCLKPLSLLTTPIEAIIFWPLELAWMYFLSVSRKFFDLIAYFIDSS